MNEKNKKLYLKISDSCHTTLVLREKGLRTIKFPWDWALVNLDSIYKWIENKGSDTFKNYFIGKKDYTSFSDTSRLNLLTRCVWDLKYNFCTPHLLDENTTIENIQDTYKQQADLFFSTLEQLDEITLAVGSFTEEYRKGYQNFHNKLSGIKDFNHSIPASTKTYDDIKHLLKSMYPNLTVNMVALNFHKYNEYSKELPENIFFKYE